MASPQLRTRPAARLPSPPPGAGDGRPGAPHADERPGRLALLKQFREEVGHDNLPLVAAGVAFFSLLAMVPALVALVSVYSLVADPATISRQVTSWLDAAPAEARALVREQLRSLSDGSAGGPTVGLVAGLAIALWSASSGMRQLIAATNVIYDLEDGRGFVRVRALALALTLGAVAFMVVALVTMAALPAILEEVLRSSTVATVVSWGRWPLLALAFAASLAVLDRVGPDRPAPDGRRRRWLSPGAILATVLWLAGSALFSFYAANFGSFNETYGSLGAIVVVMLWLWISALSVLLGLELNAVLRRPAASAPPEGAPATGAADEGGRSASATRGEPAAAPLRSRP